MSRALRAFVLVAAAGTLAACTVKETKVPPLAGPSELGLSLTLQATPDILNQDGTSQSNVVVLARDANAQPVRNVTLRLDMAVGGKLADFGTLSNRTITTGSDGRALATYTAPAPTVLAPGGYTTVDVLATPINGDYANAAARSVSIRLVPVGEITPIGDAPAYFTMSPDAPAEYDPIAFVVTFCTASQTKDCTPTTATFFAWDFGDGASATGASVSHSFTSVGTYAVTLTVTDEHGWPCSTTKTVTVKQGAAPTAAFDYSPTAPALGANGATVYVNGTASKAAAGRQIVSWEWDFGDGKQKTGALQEHTYVTANTFTIVLKVTDDVGRTGTLSKTVTVKDPAATKTSAGGQ